MGRYLIKNINEKLKDLKICPDCGEKQKNNKNWVLNDRCGNIHCEGYVYSYEARDGIILLWGNENWD